MSELTPAISKNSKILALFAVACTATVALVQLLTEDRIELQSQQQLIQQLNQVIQKDSHDNEMFRDCIIAPTGKDTELLIDVIYRARLNNMPTAAAIKTVAPDGYSGNIELLIALNIDGSVSGVRTLLHKETPGLGDKIELRKSDWITTFAGKKVLDKNDNRWAVKKDGGMFDQFTGATITPRAVVKTVRKTIDYFQANQKVIFNAASNCGVEQ
ncbi:electron transport complex subunit RsxG [Colwellia sp. MB3u-70]|uniref:electron transport complex subunit RsxG n=1 Tax=unclassified Colwellia TaxID=196834 RepID=UPI0015F5563E|nr:MULTISPECIES: electron transport complex subunit RsxG [unclassified Colwellia]MBA6290798.1 electron transport complex subunit RsxG [Colwellia sp. MB3u-8]MBA6306196.1 electron transport complex subunit RsxG [Colwellia sp. MB3u-70]